MSLSFDRECFFIAPIGDEGSQIRKRSDGVRDWVVAPAAKALGLTTLRADDVGVPGQITSQAVQHCLKAKAAVADLTGGNPNVYYELSIRHGALLPVVLIAESGTELPFDLGQSRAIFFDHTDLSDAARAREEIEGQILASLRERPDNPIADGMRLAELEHGNREEQTLARLVERMERLTAAIENSDGQSRHDHAEDKEQSKRRPPLLPRRPNRPELRALIEEGKLRPRNGIRPEDVKFLEETEPVATIDDGRDRSGDARIEAGELHSSSDSK